MTCSQLRLRVLRALAIAVVSPIVLWLLVWLLLPTEWARKRLAERLEAVSGKAVKLEALRIGLLGGVGLKGLEVSERSGNAGPWLKAADIEINLHILNILVGHCQPTQVQVDGVALRVHRLADGKMEFAGLFPGDARTGGTAGSSTSHASCVVEFTVKNGQVLIIDEPNGNRLDITAIEATGSWERSHARLQSAKGLLNGGQVELAAQIDRTLGVPMFEGQLRAQRVGVDAGMRALGYLVPIVSDTPVSVDGKLDLNLYLRTRGQNRDERRRSLSGEGSLNLSAIQVDGSRYIAELASALNLPQKATVGSVKSQFKVGDGRIASNPLTLMLGQVPLVMVGSTTYQGEVDYQVHYEGLTSRLSQDAKDLLAELPIDLNRLVGLRLTGRLNDLTLSTEALPGAPPGGDPQANERLRLKEYGRRLRDRLLR